MKILESGPTKDRVDKARAVICDDNNNVLITDYAGCLMFPGGKLDDGEDSQQAVEREVREEAGIEVENGEKLLTFQLTAENYPERDGSISGSRLVETDYYKYQVSGIEIGERQLTEKEKIGKLALLLVQKDDLIDKIENQQTDNNRWPFFKQEILMVAKYLLAQEVEIE